MGCFAAGCLSVIAVVAFLAIVCGVGGWFLYSKAIDMFTSDQPANVVIEQSNDIAYQSAKNAMARLGSAISRNESTTITLTAADVNALISRDPGFAEFRGKARVNIEDSVITLETSAPLDRVPLPKLKGRWINGTASGSFSYALGQFVFAIKSATAGYNEFPESILRGFTPSFNKSFNDGFRKGMQDNPQTESFWKHIKTISIEGDKIVVTTQQI